MSTHNTREGIEERFRNKILDVETAVRLTYNEKDSDQMIKKMMNFLHQELQKAREEIYSGLYSDLLRTEAILAQRHNDGDDEFSEEAWYSRGYFEAVDDIAKRVAKLKEDQSELDQPIS